MPNGKVHQNLNFNCLLDKKNVGVVIHATVFKWKSVMNDSKFWISTLWFISFRCIKLSLQRCNFVNTFPIFYVNWLLLRLKEPQIIVQVNVNFSEGKSGCKASIRFLLEICISVFHEWKIKFWFIGSWAVAN